jgi:hypothetical protein
MDEGQLTKEESMKLVTTMVISGLNPGTKPMKNRHV